MTHLHDYNTLRNIENRNQDRDKPKIKIIKKYQKIIKDPYTTFRDSGSDCLEQRVLNWNRDQKLQYKHQIKGVKGDVDHIKLN